MKNTIVYLIGFPGTGKLTIAKELCAVEDGLRLVDNHLINNPIFSLIELDGETTLPQAVWDNTAKVWEIVIDTMVNISHPDASFVLTGALGDDDADDHRQFNRIAKMAEARNANFVPVRLLCDLDELKKRVQSPGRKENLKDTSPNNATRLFNRTSVLKPRDVPYHDVDVTHIPAKKAAEQIRRLALP